MWTEHRLNQADKQGYAENHNQDRDRFSRTAVERDVSEACGGQRCYGEIHRINKVFDVRVGLDLRNIDKLCHDEDEKHQVGYTENNVFVLLEERKVFAQAFDQNIRAQQSDNTGSAQEREVFTDQWRKEGQDDGQIKNIQRRNGKGNFFRGNCKSCSVVYRHIESKNNINQFDEVVAMKKCRDNQKQQGHNIKGKQDITKAMRAGRIAFIEFFYCGKNLIHARSLANLKEIDQ